MSEIIDERYTPLERKMLELLEDGSRHSRYELLALWNDEMATVNNVYDALSRLRKKIEPRGELILCELWQRKSYYRHVRHIGYGE